MRTTAMLDLYEYIYNNYVHQLRDLGVDFDRLVRTTSDEARTRLIERRTEHTLTVSSFRDARRMLHSRLRRPAIPVAGCP